jgi:hypothetical protein
MPFSELIQLQGSLLLIVTPDMNELQEIESELRGYNDVDISILSLGPNLSEYLLNFPQKRWGSEASKWMVEQCRKTQSQWLICAQIDLLFEPQLMLNPLALFKSWSRYKSLFVLWPGTIEDGNLTYALPEHAHYRVWHKPDVNIFDFKNNCIYH